MSQDPVIDPVHAIPAANSLRRSRFRWRLLAFVALLIAAVAVYGRFASERSFGTPPSIARITMKKARSPPIPHG